MCYFIISARGGFTKLETISKGQSILMMAENHVFRCWRHLVSKGFFLMSYTHMSILLHGHVQAFSACILSQTSEQTKAAFSYVRLALVLKLNSGITLDTISNVTNLPFLVAAESNDRNRQFLCPVVGEKEPRSELDMCDPSYVSPMNKTLRVGIWGSYPNVINTELHQGIDFNLLTILAKKLKFTPKIIAPPSYIESVIMVCLHISA